MTICLGVADFAGEEGALMLDEARAEGMAEDEEAAEAELVLDMDRGRASRKGPQLGPEGDLYVNCGLRRIALGFRAIVSVCIMAGLH